MQALTSTRYRIFSIHYPAYQHACTAAIQNMQLACAHAEGLGSLWFTFYDREEMKKILAIKETRELIALVCLGKAAGEPARAPRKNAGDSAG